MAFVTLLNAIFVALCLMISMSYCHACSYRYNCDAHRDRSAVNRTFDGLFISSTVQQYEEQNNEGYFIEPLLLDLDTDMQRGNRAAITKWAFLRQLLAYIESYEKLVLMSDNTPVYITIEALMNSTITDACKYVSFSPRLFYLVFDMLISIQSWSHCFISGIASSK